MSRRLLLLHLLPLCLPFDIPSSLSLLSLIPSVRMRNLLLFHPDAARPRDLQEPPRRIRVGGCDAFALDPTEFANPVSLTHTRDSYVCVTSTVRASCPRIAIDAARVSAKFFFGDRSLKIEVERKWNSNRVRVVVTWWPFEDIRVFAFEFGKDRMSF